MSATVGRYVEAWADGNVDAIVEMLTESATPAIPQTTRRSSGHDPTGTVLRAGPRRARLAAAA